MGSFTAIIVLAALSKHCEGLSLEQQSSPSVAEGLGALRSATSRIWSFDVRYTVTWTGYYTPDPSDPQQVIKRPQPHKRVMQFRMVYLPARLLVEEYDRNSPGKPVVTYLYEGRSTYTRFDHNRREALVDRPLTSFGSSGTDYRIPWLNIINNYPLVSVLSHRANVVVEHQDASTGVLTLYTPSGPEARTHSSFGFRISLERARGNLPAKLVVSRQHDGREFPHAVSQVKRWRQVDSDVFVPTLTETSTISDVPGSLGAVIATSSLEVDESRSAWNKPVSDGQFTLEIPDGATITDKIRGVKYTKGVANPEQHLEKLARQLDAVAPLRSETLIAAAPWWQSTPALIAYVVLALALVYIIIRRRRLAAG